MKLCTKCNKEKHNNEFFANKNGKDGLYSICKECKNKTSKIYRKEHKSEITKYHREYNKKRKQTDLFFKFKKDLKAYILKSFKNKGWSQESTAQALLGCSYEEFYKHLGPKPGNRYEKDHICPLAQATNEDEIKKLWHYTNIRWLEHKDNLEKSDKWTPEGEELCRKLLSREWI